MSGGDEFDNFENVAPTALRPFLAALPLSFDLSLIIGMNGLIKCSLSVFPVYTQITQHLCSAVVVFDSNCFY